jgi:hypothetical protein
MSVSFANQLTPNNYPTNARNIIDNNFVQVVGMNANAAAATNTNAIDMQQATPYPVTEIVNIQIGMTGVGNGNGPANSGNINAVLQVSADNITWANSNIFATPLLSVAASNGSIAATSITIKLDPGIANSNTARYIRAQFKGEATGGTYTAGPNGFIQLLF